MVLLVVLLNLLKVLLLLNLLKVLLLLNLLKVLLFLDEFAARLVVVLHFCTQLVQLVQYEFLLWSQLHPNELLVESLHTFVGIRVQVKPRLQCMFQMSILL